LSLACSGGFLEIVKLLVAKGANINLEDEVIIMIIIIIILVVGMICINFHYSNMAPKRLFSF